METYEEHINIFESRIDRARGVILNVGYHLYLQIGNVSFSEVNKTSGIRSIGFF